MQDSQTVLSPFQQYRSSKWFIYLVINIAVFTDAYLYGLIIPVLPFALTEHVHVPLDEVQRWIGILLGSYGAGLLFASREYLFATPYILPDVHIAMAGYMADKNTSRRVPYLFGLVALAASTIMFSVGHSVTVLIVGRLVQGASSAVVHCVGMVC